MSPLSRPIDRAHYDPPPLGTRLGSHIIISSPWKRLVRATRWRLLSIRDTPTRSTTSQPSTRASASIRRRKRPIREGAEIWAKFCSHLPQSGNGLLQRGGLQGGGKGLS